MLKITTRYVKSIIFLVLICLLGHVFVLNSIAQPEESGISEAILGNWPVYKLRAKAFESLKMYHKPSNLPQPTDPDFLENRDALIKGHGKLKNREILIAESDNHYCILYQDNTAVYYSPQGKTIAYGFVDKPSFPYRLALYHYPSGKLHTVFLNFSPQDRFKFNAQGNLISGNVDRSLWERPNFEKKVFQVGQKLLQDNHIHEAISFRILQDRQEVNAFASEGGNIVIVTKGILSYLDSDDELAAVLAHEISHIILRHQVDYPDETRTDRVLQRVLGLGLGLGIEPLQDSIEFDKEQQKELDADRFGIHLMIKSGYNPEAMLSVMQKLAGDGSYIWRTHPMGSHRLKAIQRHIHFYNTAKDNQVSTDSLLADQTRTTPVSFADDTIHQWTAEQARHEIQKHQALQAELSKAAKDFPVTDPQHAYHVAAIQVHQPVKNHSLIYQKPAGHYEALLKGTQAEKGIYTVYYPKSRAYASYYIDGTRYETVLCHQANFPRACYAIVAGPRPLVNLMFQISETEGFRFTQDGKLLSVVRSARIYDKSGRLIGKILNF